MVSKGMISKGAGACGGLRRPVHCSTGMVIKGMVTKGMISKGAGGGVRGATTTSSLQHRCA